jgi:asparagine synthase (glutamine-hydrolysing)
VCGIAGFLDEERAGDPDWLARVATAMADSLAHRGPDRGAAWVDADAGLAFGHRRLAIVDLSPAGDQPMVSACGRYVIAYNGEMFNAAELRAGIEAARGPHRWRGHSDTEAMLEAVATWGVAATAQRLIGMFAFAVWDRQARTLWLVRDRLGIKPLYVTTGGGAFCFGSELKALRAAPGFAAALDADAAADFFRLGYVPAPGCILAGVRKLAPGEVLELPWRGAPRSSRFWTLAETIAAARAAPQDAGEALEQLDALLRDSVRRRLVADVKLGVFLSGGIDSSTVAALMQATAGRAVRSFSLGFAEQGFDEAPHARAVARHLGTEHTELYVTEADALAVIPELPFWFDEPFADASAVPTLLLARLARRHVTVALSGDGGDELFAGYPRYAQARRGLALFAAVPRPARRLAARVSRAVAGGARVPARGAGRALGDRAADLLELADAGALYERHLSRWPVPPTRAGGGGGALARAWHAVPVEDAGERMQAVDTLTYLPDDILTKLDRATMATALEARVPLLDHRVVAFAWSLPAGLKRRDGKGKWLLRQLLARHVPPALTERPKQGFELPVGAWLKGALRDWAEDLLAPVLAGRDPLLQAAPVAAAWQRHQQGVRDCGSELWAVLSFLAWQRRWA